MRISDWSSDVCSSDLSPFIFHVSGRSGAAILDPLREAGATTAAIHPAMTFTGDAAREVERMAGAWFAITGSSDEAVKRAGEVVDMLGGRTTQIEERHRALYHAEIGRESGREGVCPDV